jgi:hypothetical protein
MTDSPFREVVRALTILDCSVEALGNPGSPRSRGRRAEAEHGPPVVATLVEIGMLSPAALSRRYRLGRNIAQFG